MLRYFVGSIPAVILFAVAVLLGSYSRWFYKTSDKDDKEIDKFCDNMITIVFGCLVGGFLWLCMVSFVFLIRGPG